jgi:hypothetical protein
MMENIKEHRVEYFILFVAICVFIVLTYIYRFDKSALIVLSGFGSLFYIFWGIAHQWIRGKLTRSIASEYILYAILAFLMFFTVLSF